MCNKKFWVSSYGFGEKGRERIARCVSDVVKLVNSCRCMNL